MKLKNLSILVTLLVSGIINAQDLTASYADANHELVFGIKGGINFSNQNISQSFPEGNIDLDTKTFTSYHVGIYGEIMLSGKIGLQPELLYSVEGSKIDLEIGDFTGVGILEFNQKVSYIKAPILLKLKPFNNNLSVLVGPQFGFLVKSEIDLDVSDGSFDLLDSAFKDFEFSGVLGLEYDVTQKLKLGGRYNLGFSDISNTDDSSLKNRNFQFYLGLKLF